MRILHKDDDIVAGMTYWAYSDILGAGDILGSPYILDRSDILGRGDILGS